MFQPLTVTNRKLQCLAIRAFTNEVLLGVLILWVESDIYMSNLKPSCIEFKFGLGCDNIYFPQVTT